MEKRRVKINIDGMDYNLMTTEQDEYVQAVAARVDNKLKKIRNTYPQLTNNMSAVLAAINFADEYMKLEVAVDNLRKEVAEYIKNEKLFSSMISERNKKIAELEGVIKNLKK